MAESRELLDCTTVLLVSSTDWGYAGMAVSSLCVEEEEGGETSEGLAETGGEGALSRVSASPMSIISLMMPTLPAWPGMGGALMGCSATAQEVRCPCGMEGCGRRGCRGTGGRNLDTNWQGESGFPVAVVGKTCGNVLWHSPGKFGRC